MPCKLTLDEVLQRIVECHGDQITLDCLTYINTGVKARFVDNEFGSWWTLPKSILKGCKHPKRSKNAKLSIDDVKQRLHNVHNGDVILIESTYVNVGTIATFVDKRYGVWEALPYNVLNGHSHPARGRQKCEETCVRRYGVTNVMLSPEILKKSRFKRGFISEFPHWKTGEKLLCRGSYEAAFVNWCGVNQVDFDWQLPFIMPDGKTYVVDAYVKSDPLRDYYVEIKGYWYGDAERKWMWFVSEHKNAVVLMKRELYELGVLC